MVSFKLHEDRYFAMCDRCGTIFRFPLLVFDNTNEYGKEYYEIPGADADRYIEDHVAQHQKYNYESIVTLLREEFPAERYPMWLDVGSAGYPTVFKDYTFHTVEPSRKAVEKGKQLFNEKRIFQGTIETYKATGSYDGLLFNNSFYCQPSPADSLRKCQEILSPDGVVVVTLASYLNGAVQDSFDGQIDRVEDFLCGDTLQVYYNEYSLRYIFARGGFDFVGARSLPAYGLKTMIAYVFRKNVRSMAPDAQLLDQARSTMAERLESAFAGFERETAASLDDINKPNVVLYGEIRLMLELNRINPLHNVLGVIPTDVAVPAGMTLDGLKVVDINNLKDMLARQNVHDAAIRIIVVSFTGATQLASTLVAQLGSVHCEIFLPSRSSAIDSIYFDFGSSTRMSKAFRLAKTAVSAGGSGAHGSTASVFRRGIRRLRGELRRLFSSSKS